jgi:hypothetical protein
MSFAEKNRIFLTKLQSLPDRKKKIVLWTIVIILGLIMGFFWINGTINKLSNLPAVNIPSYSSADILQTTSPSNK